MQNSNSMMRAIIGIGPDLFFLSVITLFSVSSCSSPATDNPDKKVIDTLIKTIKLSDNVMVVRLGWDAVTAISTQKGIVVIDAGISNSLTSEYRKKIEKEFESKDFAFLINTHSHPDHVGGNQVFSDALIIGHENCPGEMAEYQGKIEKVKSGLHNNIDDYDKQLRSAEKWSEEWEGAFVQKYSLQSAYNDLLKDRIMTPPSLTFSERMNLEMQDSTIYLVYFGNAHSRSDIIIYFPQERLMMTGDLFSPGGKTWIKNTEKKDIDRWKTVSDWMVSVVENVNLVISGHGEIMTREDLESFIKNIEKRWMESKENMDN